LNTAPAAVICAARQAWSGRVIDFNQAPQAGASVRLEPVVTPSVGAKAGGKVGVGVVEVLTDDNGLFTVRLDPGRYAVIVDPPLGVGLARALMKVIDIDGEHEPLGGDLVLPAPAVIDGRVVDQYGLPVFGVLVDVIAPQLNGLVPTDRPGGQPDTFENGDNNVLGSTVSDVDGRFVVLVATGQVAAP
jgi:hypothetical protein